MERQDEIITLAERVRNNTLHAYTWSNIFQDTNNISTGGNRRLSLPFLQFLTNNWARSDRYPSFARSIVTIGPRGYTRAHLRIDNTYVYILFDKKKRQGTIFLYIYVIDI